jgi:dynein heavy chain
VGTALGEIIVLFRKGLAGGDLVMQQEEEVRVIDYFEAFLYNAVLQLTKRSFADMKSRLGSFSSAGFLFIEHPFFAVNVELSMPHVVLSPSLNDIQHSINSVARTLIASTKCFEPWGLRRRSGGSKSVVSEEAVAEAESPHDRLGKDRQVIKSVILLTGAIIRVKREVNEYLNSFKRYEYLWVDDKQTAYAEFIRKAPSLDEYELKVAYYQQVSQDIAQIVPAHNLGCLSLMTAPLKNSLKAEASSWKALFAEKLVQHMTSELQELAIFFEKTIGKLSQPIDTLQELSGVMNLLEEVRLAETDIDRQLNRIEERYHVLMENEIRVGSAEAELQARMRHLWKNTLRLQYQVNSDVIKMQDQFKHDLLLKVKLMHVDASHFRSEFVAKGPLSSNVSLFDGYKLMLHYRQLYSTIDAKREALSHGERLFGFPVTSYPDLDQTLSELDLLQSLYSVALKVKDAQIDFQSLRWADVMQRIDQMIQCVDEFEWAFSKLSKAMHAWPHYETLKGQIQDLMAVLPLIKTLCNKSMRPRHWSEFYRVTRLEPEDGNIDDWLITDLLTPELTQFEAFIGELALQSQQEKILENRLARISEDWSEQIFSFFTPKNDTSGTVILDMDHLATMMDRLEEAQVALGGMITNRYSMPFNSEISAWIAKLSAAMETLALWKIIQNKWLDLGNIFSQPQIAKQLSNEAKIFAAVDKQFKALMKKASVIRYVIQCCAGNDFFRVMLPYLSEQLEVVENAMHTFLDQKRSIFGRFYYVSDRSLVGLLACSTDIALMQPHLHCLFQSVVELGIRDGRVLELRSRGGEVLHLGHSDVLITGEVETWLSQTVSAMQMSVRNMYTAASRDFQNLTLLEFLGTYCEQAVLLAISLKWVQDCQNSLKSPQDHALLMKQVGLLASFGSQC